jgi:hypothetical protein
MSKSTSRKRYENAAFGPTSRRKGNVFIQTGLRGSIRLQNIGGDRNRPFNVLEELQPDKLLVYGRKVAAAVAQRRAISPATLGIWRIDIDGRLIWGTAIVHPSSSRFRREGARKQFEHLRAAG